ncbi:MAG: S1C family serine protease [Ilumatobacteraceae bacterium]
MAGKQVATYCTFALNPKNSLDKMATALESRGGQVIGGLALHRSKLDEHTDTFVDRLLASVSPTPDRRDRASVTEPAQSPTWAPPDAGLRRSPGSPEAAPVPSVRRRSDHRRRFPRLLGTEPRPEDGPAQPDDRPRDRSKAARRARRRRRSEWCWPSPPGARGVIGAQLAEPELVVPPPRAPVEIPGDRLDVAAIADLVGPSVVTVIANGSRAATSTGTGIVLSTEGELVTNAHVIGDGTNLTVRLQGEREPRVAVLVAMDVENDLAVLRLDDPAGVVWRRSPPGDVQVGDDVVAIGYALHSTARPG